MIRGIPEDLRREQAKTRFTNTMDLTRSLVKQIKQVRNRKARQIRGEKKAPPVAERSLLIPRCKQRMQASCPRSQFYIPIPMPPMIAMESEEWKIENVKPVVIWSQPRRFCCGSSSVRGGRRIFFDIRCNDRSAALCRDRSEQRSCASRRGHGRLQYLFH